MASGGDGESLFEVEDYLALQLPSGGRFPEVFRERWNGFWDNVDWWGGDPGPLGKELPAILSESFPSDPLIELGLTGWETLGRFLENPSSRGVLAACSGVERKVSFLKLTKKRRV